MWIYTFIMHAHNPYVKIYIFNSRICGVGGVACLRIAEGLYILEKDTLPFPQKKFYFFKQCSAKVLQSVYSRDNTCNYSLQIFNCHFSFLEIDAK